MVVVAAQLIILYFSIFASQEPFMKIKFARVRGERIAFQSGATSDYLAILSPLGACQ